MPDTRKLRWLPQECLSKLKVCVCGGGGGEGLKDQMWNHSLEVLEQVTIMDECNRDGF